MAKVLDMAARRMANGNPQAVFPLLANDLEPGGFNNPRTLAKYRKEVLEHGFLNQVCMARYGQDGETRECGLYRLGETDLYGKTYHKKPDFHGKAYHLDVVNSIRSSVSVMSKLFDLI